MREAITDLLNKYELKRGSGFDCLVTAVEQYGSGETLKDIYTRIAVSKGMSASAVEKSVSACISSAPYDIPLTPKAFIAHIKERFLFEFDE